MRARVGNVGQVARLGRVGQVARLGRNTAKEKGMYAITFDLHTDTLGKT